VILNAEANAEKIDELINVKCCNYISWVYSGNGRLLWVLDKSSQSSYVEDAFKEARKLLPERDVISLVQLEEKEASSNTLYTELNRYSALAEGNDGSEDNSRDEKPEEEDDLIEEEDCHGYGGDFRPVRDERAAKQQRAKFEKMELVGKVPCSF
jgi:hypothetical protein